MQVIKPDKRTYQSPVNFRDNVSIDADFEEMPGDCSGGILDHNAPAEVRLFQTVVLGDLLRGGETPEEFIRYIRSRIGRQYCSMADLNPDFLELAVKRIYKHTV